MSKTVVVLNAMSRRALDGRLPDWVEPHYFDTIDELNALAPTAEIGWFDSFLLGSVEEPIRRAEKLRWLNTLAAGVDRFPLDLLRTRGIAFTNGGGLNAVTIAEYAVLGMLTIAKDYREVVRAQDRREWLTDAPGKRELQGSRALIIGAGGIGGRIAELLRAFDVEVATVRRTPAPGVLSPDQWRERLGDFDWVIIAVPGTPDTEKMIGAAELAAMKPGVGILNFARGAVIDRDALITALNECRIGGAFLDVTDPEPLPPDDPLWSFDNVHITMHLSGRSQNTLVRRASERFLENLGRFQRGEPLISAVDLSLGY